MRKKLQVFPRAKTPKHRKTTFYSHENEVPLFLCLRLSFSINSLRFRRRAAKFRRNILPVQMLNEERLRCIDPRVIKHSAQLMMARCSPLCNVNVNHSSHQGLESKGVSKCHKKWDGTIKRRLSCQNEEKANFESVFRALSITSQKVHGWGLRARQTEQSFHLYL